MYEFRDAIAKITIEGTEVRATGFLVAPSLVATALHVVADRTTEPPIFSKGLIHLEFREYVTDAEVMAGKWDQDSDCVLLRCLKPAPSDDYPIIPLRELSQFGDPFRTFGYPDAQPINGTTWDGDVTSYTEELTNYYQTRSSSHKPVLQLFCKQAAAGTGAPPRGLSGAPVIVGTAAVGLMRYALMRDGGTLAGTLYACCAKDIMALDPEKLNLRPPLAPAVILTPEQATRLKVLLGAAFAGNLYALRRMVRFSIGVEAERSVDLTKDLTEYVSTLLSELLQQGPGIISVLLRGAIMARPSDQNLRDFAQQFSSYALEPLNDNPTEQESHDQALVDTIAGALIDLNGLKPILALKNIIVSYRPEFEKSRRQINVLSKYKILHSCLHDVQDHIEEIANNVKRFKTGDKVQRYLRDNASFLKELAQTAANQLSELPTDDQEREWIKALDNCAVDLKTATVPTAPIPDREKVLDVPDRLARILARSSKINEELVSAAKSVRLDNLAETMRSVEPQLGSKMPASALESLRKGSLAVGRLRSRLAGLVAEHDEWQSLNTDLECAKAQTKHQPQARFSSWKQFKAKLIGMCETFPQEAWSIELKKTIEPWMADEVPPEPQLASSISQVDDDFFEFYQQCIKQFIKVDNELKVLCVKITSFSVPLDAFLDRNTEPHGDDRC